MNKKSIIPFIIIVVLIVGILIITNQKPKEVPSENQPIPQEEVKITDDTNTINSDLDSVDLDQDYNEDLRAIDEEANKL